MLGDENYKVPEIMRPYKSGQPVKKIVLPDEFEDSKLGLHWQWNHNPVDEAWNLTERPGFLRLKTSRVVPNLYLAPNTLTQRMEGPACSGYICMDLKKMKDGGIDVVASYVFWIHHEEEQGTFDFSGNKNIRRFVISNQ